MIKYLLPALALVVPVSASAQEQLSGVAKAIDGDTLWLGADKIRLFGVDAPELDQSCTRDEQKWACGRAATEQLATVLAGRQTVCITKGIDDFRRLLARCTANGIDINSLMVLSGYAVAFRRYSTEYVPAEDSAKAGRRGIWAGTFEMPSDRRQATRKTPGRRSAITKTRQLATHPSSPSAERTSNSCDIKGNRNRKGEWIYHLPGMPYYNQTRAEEVFCSEAKAQAAGYRRAIVR